MLILVPEFSTNDFYKSLSTNVNKDEIYIDIMSYHSLTWHNKRLNLIKLLQSRLTNEPSGKKIKFS